MHRKPAAALLLALTLPPLGSCGTARSTGAASTRFGDGISELEVQALAMQMADDYSAALGETTYLVLRRAELEPTARWLALSFLRNGMGAAIGIAAGPNPDIAVLDLLVLGSLQTWSFGAHWIPAGIDAALGAEAVARLQAAEAAMWRSAGRVLDEQQATMLRGLIDQWIAEHPDQTVVSLVRLADFTEERELSTAGARGDAALLLREIGEAVAAVEDTRLLGERALWFASRYPYVLGQQAELTAYRIADQPEVRQATQALAGVGRLGEAVAARLDNLEAEQQTFFDRIAAERATTIEAAFAALDAALSDALEDLAARVAEARAAAIESFFARLQVERDALLELIERTRTGLDTTLREGQTTAAAATAAGRSLTAMAAALDRLVARFDQAPEDGREPLRLRDLRDAAAAADAAAGRLLDLFARIEAAADAGGWQQGLAGAEAVTTELADGLLWRGAGLVALLVGGLALVRLVPNRQR